MTEGRGSLLYGEKNKKKHRHITVYLLVEEDLNREQLSPAFEMAEHFGHCRIVMIYPQKDFPRLFCSDETSCAPSETFFRPGSAGSVWPVYVKERAA